MQIERLGDPAAHALPGGGPLLLTPTVHGDARGFFYESWNRRRFAELLEVAEAAAPDFVQDNHSRSARGVLRGLHFQLPPEPQGKLVRCVLGEIFDVAVDLRRDSPAFGQWCGARLSDTTHQQLWIPVGFAHGFLTLSAHAEVLYKASGYWNRSCERSLRWNDPQLAIAWPFEALQSAAASAPDSPPGRKPEAAAEPILAAKDAAAPGLAELLAAGEVF